MGPTLAIAQNTFREVVRNRIFIVLILMSSALTSLVLAMSSVSLNEEQRVVVDVGFFLVSSLTVILSILLGGNMVHKELERKTIYTILSKPISRYEFILGKYLGNILVSFVLVAILGSLLGGCLSIVGGDVSNTFIYGVWFIFVEVMIVSALSIFFISFSSPILSGALAVGVFVSGRFAETLSTFQFGKKHSDFAWLEQFVHGFAAIVPDLSLYNVTPHLVHGQTLSLNFVVQASLAGISYVAVCLILGSLIFSRRDLT